MTSPLLPPSGTQMTQSPPRHSIRMSNSHADVLASSQASRGRMPPGHAELPRDSQSHPRVRACPSPCSANPPAMQRLSERGYWPVLTLPGRAVGAGRAVTVGANEPTLAFSVGARLGALVDDDGFVSAGLSLLEHAVRAPEPKMAAAPAISATCRTTPDDHICPPVSSARAIFGPPYDATDAPQHPL
jgi:hypothetical protein